ncbi:MAG: hypothetical protein O9320_19235 [Magnetospirillum sp.]|nr:hypothetical protein [Magnetospirillum sp.]
MSNRLTPPNILLASKNVNSMIKNLEHVLTQPELDKIHKSLDVHVTGLFELGIEHYKFAKNLPSTQWRQKISRCYYAVYHVRRATMLKINGHFSQDVSDHGTAGDIPNELSNREAHINFLRSLREDRNLADYTHGASESNLVNPVSSAFQAAEKFIADCQTLLTSRGVIL